MEKIEVGDIFTLMDENDQEQEIEVLGTLTIDEVEYAAVAFADEIDEDSEGDIDVFFLRVEDDEQLSLIESDEEFDKVSAAFKEYEDEDDAE
ncbi:DUF1292 domain-containing protein [Paenisporosarcina quisquiliarum]|jgi:uncharacterized protein YrzB (UPF0473 family)|uniref:DUF1292 domain-containing protein n=1 Tax=Paenisporosarcina quisquiliarum TaxID=365346 RepID=A0A9X3LIG4_9BACL|nr:DUF1292 domain-containing protein [Paenisporosarcina quisquiliarum]MCZ8538543.1 DUF1292 domain-containing protein [Paenisporosarcina quisquiliarum]